MRAKIYVVYGQGGLVTSSGMLTLADRCAKLFPDCEITTDFEWRYPGNIAKDINTFRRKNQEAKIIFVGFSLGANCLGWMSEMFPRTIVDLGVAYDPSRHGMLVAPIGKNIKRCICYHNIWWDFWGGLKFTGPTVEVITTSKLHMNVQHEERLHQITIRAIEDVL